VRCRLEYLTRRRLGSQRAPPTGSGCHRHSRWRARSPPRSPQWSPHGSADAYVTPQVRSRERRDGNFPGQRRATRRSRSVDNPAGRSATGHAASGRPGRARVVPDEGDQTYAEEQAQQQAGSRADGGHDERHPGPASRLELAPGVHCQGDEHAPGDDAAGRAEGEQGQRAARQPAGCLVGAVVVGAAHAHIMPIASFRGRGFDRRGRPPARRWDDDSRDTPPAYWAAQQIRQSVAGLTCTDERRGASSVDRWVHVVARSRDPVYGSPTSSSYTDVVIHI
jgi:hypothetical protein